MLVVYFIGLVSLLANGGHCGRTWDNDYINLSRRIDRIQSDMDSMMKKVEDLMSTVNAKNQKLASFEKRLSEVAEERLAYTDTHIKDVAAAEVGRRTHHLSRGLEKEKAETMTRFESLRKIQDKLLSRTEDIEKFQDAIVTRADGMDTRMNETRVQIYNLEQGVIVSAYNTSTFFTKVGTLENTQAQMKGTEDKTRALIAVIEHEVKSSQRICHTLQSQVHTLVGTQADLQSKTSTIEAKVETTRADISRLTEDKTRALIAVIKEEVKSTQRNFHTLQSQVQTLAATQADLQSKTMTIEAKVDTTRADIIRLQRIPVDGQWGPWAAWSVCTSYCYQTRTRACDNPAPLHAGRDCPGLTTQTQECNPSSCKLNGQWGPWAAWSVCTSYCNQTRTRACDNPAPLHAGRDCPGLTTQTQKCNPSSCKLDGQWGPWAEWSLCTSHCNQTRTRVCNNPAPLHGGKDCPGLTTQTQECNTSSCGGKDCSELLSKGAAKLSGVYNITTPLTHTKIQVYCDMETDGGGWTVFQKRSNGNEDFYRNFRDYENGFGSVYAEYWLGLKYIYELTSLGYYQLRVDIARSDGSKGYDVYGGFSLQPGTSYTLNVGSRLRSNGVLTENSFHSSRDGTHPVGNAFSTYDHDVDRWSIGNCAADLKGGWWYNACNEYINLNGLYRPGQGVGQHNYKAMTYDSLTGLAASTMMFKSVS